MSGRHSKRVINQIRHDNHDIVTMGRGMSVFRHVKGYPLGDVGDVIEKVCGRHVFRTRGLGGEKPPAISMLSVSDVKHIEPIAHVPVKDVINILWDEVPSLREAFYVGLGKVAIFGRKEAADMSLVVTLDQDSIDRLFNERSQIVDVIKSLAPVGCCIDSNINPQQEAHLSIARISSNTPGDIIEEVSQEVREVLPESIFVQRAIMRQTKSSAAHHSTHVNI